MTIKQATVINYQSHKRTVLNFHSGVNALVGLSDCGKSAFMRAIQWPIRNKNEDRGFRSKWGGKCDVELVFADGKVVSRVQDKENAYYLYDTTENIDEEYKAFKTDIPQDIAEALNMNNINIQSQFDSPFLLADSAGDVAKLLNKIANLQDIDESISNIRKQVLANSKIISETEHNIEDLEVQEKSFEYLDQMEKDVNHWELVNQWVAENLESINRLSTIIDLCEKDQAELDEINCFLKAEVAVTDVLALVDSLNSILAQIKSIEVAISSTEELQLDVIEIEKILGAEYDLDCALGLVEELDAVKGEYNALGGVLDKINTYTKSLEDKERNLINKQATYNQLMPKQCPLCEKEIN